MRLDQYAGILKQLDSAKSTADVDLIPLTGFETQKGLEDFLTRRDAKKKALAANDLQAYANVLSDPEFQTPEAQMHLGERATGWADPANPNSVSALQGAGDKAFTVGALAELNQKARSGEQIDPMLAARLSVQSGNLLDNYMKLPELAGKQATNTDNQAFNEAMAVINANQYPMTPAGFTQYQTDVRDMAANTGQTPQTADEIINREGARWQGTGVETKPYTLRTGRATETGVQTVNPFGKVIDTRDVSYTEPVKVAGAGGHSGGGSGGQAAAGDVDALVEMAHAGKLDPNTISKRGGLQAAVYAELYRRYPDDNIIDMGANANFVRNPQIQRSIKVLDSITPILGDLKSAHAALGFGKNPVYNWTRRKYLEQTGDKRLAAYDNLRNNIILETTVAMQGSSVMSDARVNMEKENLGKLQSPEQMDAAIANIRKIIGARRKAMTAPITSSGSSKQVAPAGTKARLKNGRVVTSDGKGGWK